MIHKYTEEQDKFLIDNVKGISLKELTEKFNNYFNLNLSLSSISNRKSKLKIRSGIYGGQFVKGFVPFNKGMKWNDYMPKESQDKSRKTTFKKGDVPHNHKPVGSERIAKDNYIEIKVEEPDVWVSKNRYIYEQHYGSIPKGYMVIFADGDKRNFDLDNLLLVSNNEELIMNNRKLRFNDKELTKTGHLISKVIAKVNEVKK